MRQNGSSFTTAQKIGSFLLMLALVWLSVCIPYVYRFQQQVKTEKQSLASTHGADADDDGGLMNNTTEEKAESSSPTSNIQEFLHEPLHLEHPSIEQVNEYGHFEQKASVAFHPEYVAPPPEA
ncbi:hypothetical protein EPD60_03090 [Flaviaesturariibacter flavus]|uniref:Uncharacterized protein n=1 Tax=Flaviaesturariibacter flavus TaxID=2502780 RepID=A0A4R1BML8_9BACT|nr:hypothetical protein [Flaviaesturariibacter flavus]TCJ18760.1 hypothetical protein EPD60_03090 [Flaviaesturariibacter flavus]